MQHVNIFCLILLPIAGAWSLSSIARERAVLDDPLLGSLWRHLFLFICYSFYAGFLGYAYVNLPAWKGFLFSVPLRTVNGVIFNAAVLGMCRYLLAMVMRLMDKPVPRAVEAALLSSFLLPAAAIILRYFFDAPGDHGSIPFQILRYYSVALDIFSIACLVRLAVWNHGRTRDMKSRAVNAFVVFQGIFFLFYLNTAADYLPFLPHWPGLSAATFNRVSEIVFALAAFAWLKLYFIPLRKSIWEDVCSSVNLEAFQSANRLTKREVEVLRHLVEGRSYRQTGVLLFISVNTVKNHAYSLFKKLGANSRNELIGKIADFRQGGAG